MFETFRVEDPARFSKTSPDENQFLRADSPMQIRRSLSSTPTATGAVRENYTDDALLGSDIPAMPEQPSGERSPPSRAARSASSGGDVRFVVINHPEQLHNRSELRKNRQHVMKDFLTKAAKDPNTRDIRITNQVAGRKRRMGEIPSTGTSTNPVAPSMIFRTINTGPQAASNSTRSVHTRTSGSTDVDDDAESVQQRAKLVRPDKTSEADKRTSVPLVSGISGRFRNYAYLGTTPDEVPFALHHINGSLNPFDTWPKFDDPRIRVNELKWSCSRRFGSRGIADHWVPMLLSARHAFLSTIVISSAHDDIMSRQSKHPDQRPRTESVARATVRHEVTNMINECMRDPVMQTSDATLVAVLHLLNAGIMGCDDKDMKVHQQGIYAMVRQRGGLNALGVHGQLAMICTITMFIVASLRETVPDSLFVQFATVQKTQIPKGPRNLPESPLYCRQTGYQTLTKVVKPESRIYKLLELCRQITNAYWSQHNEGPPEASSPSHTTAKDEVAALTIDIFSMPRAAALSFEHPSERYTYEAIRLTALIFSQALSNNVPLSTAARQLQLSGGYTSLGTGAPTTVAPVVEDCLMHIHIRNALIRTDTADCWGHLAGVLFWIALVAGAAANPETGFWTGGYRVRRVDDGTEEEEARKWLAAIVVRCSIVLGFEYGTSILGTMKMMMRIQESLERSKGSRSVDHE